MTVTTQSQTPRKSVRRRAAKKKRATAPGGSIRDQQVIKHVAAPMSYGSSMTMKSRGRGGGSYRFTRTEYIMDIPGATGAFTLQAAIPLNPGLKSFLPWGFSVANSYDLYKFHSLRFCYYNKTSSTNKGEIALVFEPDPTDATPDNLVNALNDSIHYTGSSWMDGSFNIPRENLNRIPKFLTRNSIVASDVTTFDVGILWVIVSLNADTSIIGQLWVEYDVEYFSPQMNSGVATPPKVSTELTHSATQPIVGATPLTLLWDTVLFNPLGIATPVAGAVTGLSGGFSIYAQATLTASAVTATATIGIWKNGAAVLTAYYPPAIPSGSTASMNVYALVALVPSDVITIVANSTAGGTVGSLTNKVLIIAPA